MNLLRPASARNDLILRIPRLPSGALKECKKSDAALQRCELFSSALVGELLSL
jgi:hypothetical protein